VGRAFRETVRHELHDHDPLPGEGVRFQDSIGCFDVLTFNGWMYANATGNEKLKELYERRFRPELRVAFNDWLKLDPMHNPDAPAGQGLMPSFKDPLAEEATRLAHEAQTYFEEAAESRETGDQYVKVTVLLATVLLLTALSQRFKPLGPRVIVIAIALVLLLSSMTLLVRLPRAEARGRLLEHHHQSVGQAIFRFPQVRREAVYERTRITLIAALWSDAPVS